MKITELRIGLIGRAMAQAISRRTLTEAAWVRAQVNPVGFVVDKVALGQGFLRLLRFFPVPVNILPLQKNSFIPSFIRGWTIGP
jgi:hypothetical protein